MDVMETMSNHSNHKERRMKNSKNDDEAVQAEDETGVVAGINMLLGNAHRSNINNDHASLQHNNPNEEPSSASNNLNTATLKTNPIMMQHQTSSIASSNSNSGSIAVTFALPAAASAPPTRTSCYGGSHSGGEANSSGSLSSTSGGGEQQRQHHPQRRPVLRNGNTTTGGRNIMSSMNMMSSINMSLGSSSSNNNPNRISSNTCSSNTTSNSGSGSGSDQTNTPMVTSSSGANTNNSSGSGSDGGMETNSLSHQNHHQRGDGDNASLEYYYAGYGSGSLATDGSNSGGPRDTTVSVGTGVNGGGVSNSNAVQVPSFASFRGSSLAAAAELNRGNNNAAAAVLPHPEGMTRHVLVAANDASNPPNFHHASSHLRHHRSSRRSTNTSSNNVTGGALNMNLQGQHHSQQQLQQHQASSSSTNETNGIPSTIGTNRRSVRLLPPPGEQEQQQRHITVMAPSFPPPSDVWSSGSSMSGGGRSSGGSGGERKRPATNTAALASSMRPTASTSTTSATSNAKSAVHVSTMDPILKPNSMLFSPQHNKKVAIQTSSSPPDTIKADSSKDGDVKVVVSSKKTNVTTTTAIVDSSSKKKNLKRKAFMLTPTTTTTTTSTNTTRSDDSSDGVRSDTEAVGSGSEEGYEASSSSNAERQSGSSGSDSVSSDDANKNKVLKSSRNNTATGSSGGGGGGGSPKSKSGNSIMESSKRTETSSMSSSVLADFSSGVNEELNSFSSSPNSSCMSLNEFEEEKAKVVKGESGNAIQGPEPMETEPLPQQSTTRTHRKRPHHETELKDTDIDMSAPDTTMKSGLALMEKSLQQKVRSTHHYHSRSTGRKMLEESFLSAKRNLSSGSSPEDVKAVTASALDSTTSSVSASGSATVSKEKLGSIVTNSAHRPMKELSYQDTLVYSLGPDVMALVVSFLEVPESHTFLTSPLSKTWLETYTVPQELWKILCTSKPFYAKLEESPDGNSDISTCSFPLCNDLEIRHLFGRYRLLYSSFVRCVKYLDRLRDDAINGRTPSVYNDARQDLHPYNRNGSLKAYFARARRLVRRNRRSGSPSSSSVSGSLTTDSGEEQKTGESKVSAEAAAASSRSENSNGSQRNSQPRLGRSMLTERLLRPTRTGDVDNVNLPWSCAIYSVVNWMVAFVDVEGIQVRCRTFHGLCFWYFCIQANFFFGTLSQIMCLKVLPYLLEDETQRTTAQRAGLTDSVLRAMVIFPDSIELHTAAFHTLVLLARPLGGNEGMLFHTAMVNTRGIFNSSNNSSASSKNGIVIMLDSMRRFAQDEMLQAMSCWSLVNVALTPLQKSMLVKLGGLTVTANAMLQHPYNAEVQFRALFALINLVIPCKFYVICFSIFIVVNNFII